MKSRGQIRTAFVLSVAAAVVALAGATTASAKSIVVGRLTLDAYSPTTVGHSAQLRTRRLAKGKLYVLNVQGTVSFYAAVDYLQIQKPFTRFCGRPQAAPLFGSAGGVGPVSNDAAFIFAQPISSGSCAALKLPVEYPNFQVNNGFGWGHPALLSPKPIRRPTANHSYNFAIVGQGRPLGAELVDPDTRDDYGSFRITVRKAIASDCSHHQWKAFALKRAAICTGDTAHTTGTIPKPAKVKPLKTPQGPIAHVVRDSDFPTAVNAQLPAGALGAARFARYATIDAAAARKQRTILAGHKLRSAAIAQINGKMLPLITSTAMQFAGASKASSAYVALAALDAGANAPGSSSAAVSAAPGLSGETITYKGASPGIEVIAHAGTGVYALRESQTAASGPVSAGAVRSLLGSLIRR